MKHFGLHQVGEIRVWSQRFAMIGLRRATLAEVCQLRLDRIVMLPRRLTGVMRRGSATRRCAAPRPNAMNG